MRAIKKAIAKRQQIILIEYYTIASYIYAGLS